MTKKINFFPALFLAVGILVLPTSHAWAASIATPSSGLSVTVDENNGTYAVTAAKTGWNFEGMVSNTISKVTTAKGKDKLGSFQELRFGWTNDSNWTGAIRSYDERPLISFSVGTNRAALGPTPDFPNFTAFPKKLHSLSFQDSVFAPPAFRLVQTSTPWFLFDDSGDTAVISPASDFLVSQMHGDGDASIGSGLNAQVGQLPAGFKHTSFMVFDSGVAKTFKTWGDALTGLSGKPITPDNADELVKYLGYWTDNGAYYYYNYDKSRGYADTLVNLRKQYQQNQIPIRYMQLDSWWYQKSLRNSNGSIGAATKNAELPVGTWNAYGGTLDYSASPVLFPKGLTAFSKDIDLPFAVHGRWIDPTGPYRKNYLLSGVAPVDPKWWDERMTYLKAAGVKTYEQDWLNEIYGNSPALARDLKAGPAFTDNMARAAKANGLSLQYCMATARYFMQGSNYSNLTTIRTSGDRFERNKWDEFIYTSLYADAMHIRPWTDVFMSTESGNLTIATLSSGPVGVGDELGKESKEALMSTCRTDGVLIKPSAPLLPTDATILADARGEKKAFVGSTFVDNGQRSVYAFVFPRPDDSRDYSFTPASLGMSGKVYAYEPNEKTAKTLDASEPIQGTVGTKSWALYLIAPAGPSGVAFMGDIDKIVGVGKQRVASVREDGGQLAATIVLAPTENAVTLHGYAETAPTVSSPDGKTSPVQYDAATHHFTFQVSPAEGAKPALDDGEPVNKVQVVIKAQ